MIKVKNHLKEQPTTSQKKRPIKATVEAIKRFREGHTLKGISIRQMIDEGRR